MRLVMGGIFLLNVLDLFKNRVASTLLKIFPTVTKDFNILRKNKTLFPICSAPIIQNTKIEKLHDVTTFLRKLYGIYRYYSSKSQALKI
uniref:Uncharacterized protein n=1 Tax=Megaselia scalaris TaxID=36166 RepID=T1GUZ6_MEGSC